MEHLNSFNEIKIGIIPEKWDVLKLDDVIEKVIDNRGKTPPLTQGGYELLEVNSIKADHRSPDYSEVKKFVDKITYKNWFRTGHILKDDLIIPTVGTIGNLAVSLESRGSIAQNLIALRFNKKINSTFVYYLLSSPDYKEKLLNLDIGGVQPSIKVPHLLNLEIYAPGLSQQKQIAEILSSLDDKIELNRKINANLEKMASALFKKWFVDIGDELPEGWRMGKLGEEFEIIMGQSPSGDTYNESGEGTPFYQGRTDFGSRFPIRRVYCTDPQRKAMASDTLISVRAPVGDVNMATEECCIGRGVGAIRKDGFSSYTFYMIKALQSEIAEFDSEGTIFGSINKNSLANISCVVPPKNIVVEFEKKAKDIDSQILNLSKEIQNLTSIRDSLLPRLMNGKLRVLYGK